MDFRYTDEQDMLRDSVRAYLRDRYTFEHRTAAVRSDEGWRPKIWKDFVDLGLIGAGLPETSGGFGGGAIEHMIIMEEFGRALVSEPYLETAIIGAGLLTQFDCSSATAVLADVLAGEALLALAWTETGMRYDPADIALCARPHGQDWTLSGDKCLITAAPWATHLVVAARSGGEPGSLDGLSLFLVARDSPGLSIVSYPTIDGRRAADAHFDNVSVSSDTLLGEAGKAGSLLAETVDRASAALCAEALGVLRRLYEDTLEYTRQRRQFGQTLSSFQVLQHRLVDMFMHIEMATAATYLATLKLDDGSGDRARAVSTAKVTIGEACRFVGQNAVQLHGGMGMSDELPVSHFFSRSTVIESEYGSTDFHLARFVELSLSEA